jgi:hypothetical protein
MLNSNFIITNTMVSDTPLKDTWDLLSLNLIENHINSTSGGYHFSKSRIECFKLFLSQAREFYESSSSCSLLTSPLLDFYCYSLLAKMLTMKLAKIGNEALEHRHGLKIHILESPITNSSICVELLGNGTFHQLINSTQRETKITAYNNITITLDSLLHYDIDIIDYTPNESRVYPIHYYNCELEKNGNITLTLRMAGRKNANIIDYLNTVHPDLELNGFTVIDKKFDFGRGILIKKTFDGTEPLPSFNMEINALNQFFLIPPLDIADRKLQFYQYEIIYLILFIASNLVRYYPKEWNSYIQDEKRFWPLRKAISYAKRSFPNYILNYISTERHVILPPGIFHYS